MFPEEATATHRLGLRRLTCKDCCEAPNGLLPCLSLHTCTSLLRVPRISRECTFPGETFRKMKLNGQRRPLLMSDLVASMCYCNYTLKILSSCRYAVMQHQCNAALVRAKCKLHYAIPTAQTNQGKMHFPLLRNALQNRLTACLCHCNYTYVDLVFMQVCSDATSMHCSTGQGKMHFPLLRNALQNRLTACLCHCNYTYGDLVFTRVCSDATPMHCSTGQGKIASPLFSALQIKLTASQS